jgi:hypothetical protein
MDFLQKTFAPVVLCPLRIAQGQAPVWQTP